MDTKVLINMVSRKSGVDASVCQTLIKELGDIITDNCDSSHNVMIPGFGCFESVKEDEQIVVEPATGKRVLYPPVLRMVFTPASALVKKVSGNKNDSSQSQ